MTYRLPQIKKTFALQLVCPTGLMISPPASTISLCLRVCVFLFQCQAAGIINGTPPEYQLSWFARKREKKKTCIYWLTGFWVSQKKQRKAPQVLAPASFCSSGALYFLMCVSLCRNAAISPFQLPAQSSAFLPLWHENKLRLSASACMWSQTPLSAITGWETAINCTLEAYNGLLQRWQNLYHIMPLPIQTQIGSLFLITIQQVLDNFITQLATA